MITVIPENIMHPPLMFDGGINIPLPLMPLLYLYHYHHYYYYKYCSYYY